MTFATSRTKDGGNELLKRLDLESRNTLEKHFESIILPVGYKCVVANQKIDKMYFPLRGIIRRAAPNRHNATTNAGLYGREGCSAFPLLFGVDHSPHDEIVHVAGEATRVPTSEIVDLQDRNPAFRGLLLRFAYCMSLQVNDSGSVGATGDLRERLCRLLVMCHDRIAGHGLSVTHDFLATTLGVRRASVTEAIHHLEGDHLIKGTRGLVTIRDRDALKANAGLTYGLAEREYERLICNSPVSCNI